MWIRSQDKRTLININECNKKIYIYEFYVGDALLHNKDDETNASIYIGETCLGTYSTLDRAIRELDSIESAISSMVIVYQVTKETKGDEHYG